MTWVFLIFGALFAGSLRAEPVTMDEHLHEVLKLADVINPWAVGRYQEVNFYESEIMIRVLF